MASRGLDLVKTKSGHRPRRLLAAIFNGRRRALDTKELQRASSPFPRVTLKIVAAIHWEALRLWLKSAQLAQRAGAGSNPCLASGKSNDYTSPVLSTRAQD